jgi:hypothetical protein
MFLHDDPDGPRVRRGSGFRRQHLNLAPSLCLGIDKPLKTPLIDV